MNLSIKRAKIVISTFVLAFAVIFRIAQTPVLASGLGAQSQDVDITVHTEYGPYRYACDIEFYNMRFLYELQSIAHNNETGEEYVNNGRWLLDYNLMKVVPMKVINHSDTPVAVTAHVDSSPFDECGVSVSRTENMINETVRECILTSQGAKVSESVLQLSLSGYPDLYSYEGIKSIYTLVEVRPVPGISSGGEKFPG